MANEDYQAFVDRQEDIYNRNFRNTSRLEAEGLKPSVPQNEGGYIVALRHARNITNELEWFNARILDVVPRIIAYDRNNAHTTITTTKPDKDFSPDANVLEEIVNVVRSAGLPDSPIQIDYTGWLLNQNTGIAAGNPNEEFYNQVVRVVKAPNAEEVGLKMPWGSHITALRFLTDNATPADIGRLLHDFNNFSPLGLSIPTSVDVGHFILTPKGFSLEVYERFPLRPE